MSDIPGVALQAYQRAAGVIDASDKACHLPWTVLAAIGRVESDHGRFGSSALSNAGVSTPAVYGVPLDGRKHVQTIADTDGGSLDQDPMWDRAVGPMQFLPSTWSVVAVDGDGDGRRDPQDINDAALGAAVYLCAGDQDLATPAGQRAAVHRYNHSAAYVDLVLGIAQSYERNDPAIRTLSSVFEPMPIQEPTPASHHETATKTRPARPAGPASSPSPAPTRPSPTPAATTPTPTPT
ncbi:MAG: lytic transglycosylase domain-containing protein, partial [Marmoricola sp.]